MTVIAEDASNVPKLLKVDASGNLKTTEQGTPSVVVSSPLTAGGAVKTAEQVDWLPSAKGKTMLFLYNTAAGQTTVARTVTAGKTFYLVYAELSYNATANAIYAFMTINASVALVMLSKTTATYYTTDTGQVTLAPAVPIPLPAGTTINVISNAATLTAFLTVVGWEE